MGLWILSKSVFSGMDTRISATVPPLERPTATLREVARAWASAGSPEREFARDLEKVGAADRFQVEVLGND